MFRINEAIGMSPGVCVCVCNYNFPPPPNSVSLNAVSPGLVSPIILNLTRAGTGSTPYAHLR